MTQTSTTDIIDLARQVAHAGSRGAAGRRFIALAKEAGVEGRAGGWIYLPGAGRALGQGWQMFAEFIADGLGPTARELAAQMSRLAEPAGDVPQEAWTRVDTGRHLHTETGFEVVKIPAHREFGYAVGTRWEVRRPRRRGGWGVIASMRTLSAAQEWLTVSGIVEVQRRRIAADHAEALIVADRRVTPERAAGTRVESFRGVEGGGRYVNIETGVEILRSSFGGWMVVRPARNAEMIKVVVDMIPTVKQAKAAAVPVVEAARAELALAHDAATREIADAVTTGLTRAHDDLATGEPNRAISTLLFGARHSLNSRYVVTAYDRLTRAVAAIHDRTLIPSDDAAAHALMIVRDRAPIGAQVTARGLPARVDRMPFIDAETNRVVVPVRFTGGGDGSVYADDMTWTA